MQQNKKFKAYKPYNVKKIHIYFFFLFSSFYRSETGEDISYDKKSKNTKRYNKKKAKQKETKE